ncbi:O-antigen polymerase [Microbacterium schleiferi]|uniref:O-antigen polymerase n=1 Tax=Microbacterium schleiferi TaxID=69362 RepID=UPI001D1707BC|nr:O-antigen polymerase [Microbacterium schleiferi]MCC4266748.1 oligosaccharide repeat unit polymerase [Microbacterium schleiferi]
MTDVIARVLQGCGVVLLVVTLLASTISDSYGSLGVASGAYLAANVALFAYIVLHSRRGGVSLITGFFFLFFIAIPAYLQIDAGVFPFNSSYAWQQLLTGFAIFSVAQLAYLVAEMQVDSSRPTRIRALGQEMRAPFFRKASVAILLANVAIIAFVGSRLFLTRTERGGEIASAEGGWLQLLFIGRSISLVGVLICLQLLIGDTESRRSSGFRLVALLSFATFLMLNYPPGLSRFQLLGSVIAIVAVLTSFFRRSRKVLFALIAPVFLLLFFPTIKALGNGGEIDIAGAVGRDVGNYLLGVDFDGFKQTVDSWIYVDRFDVLRWGENFLGAALFWVPRDLWPGKPVDSGGIVSGALGYRYTNVSNPLPAEAYLSFGYVGVLLVFILLGLIVTRVERRALVAGTAGIMTSSALLLALMMGFATIVLRGALNGVAPMFLSAFLLYAMLMALQSMTSERPRSRATTRAGRDTNSLFGDARSPQLKSERAELASWNRR